MGCIAFYSLSDSENTSNRKAIICLCNQYFKNYIIKRGETVEVPEGLAELIENGDKAEEAALEYADKKGLREP